MPYSLPGSQPCQDLQDLGIEIAPAWQLDAVELLVDAGLDEARHVDAGHVDHVIAGAAGQHLGLHFLGGAVGVVGRP